MKITSKASGVLFALATAVGLGAITTQAKIIYAGGGNALTIMLVRFVMSTLVFGVIILVNRDSFKIERQSIFPLLQVGMVWSATMIFYLLSVTAVPLTFI